MPSSILASVMPTRRVQPRGNRIRSCAALACIFVVSCLTAVADSQTAGIETLVADFNHDGIPDLLVTSTSTFTATIAFGAVPYGTFAGNPTAITFPAACTGVTSGAVNVGNLAAADFNGDGFPDLYFTCTTNSSGASLTGILLGKGDGTFAAPVLLNAPYANSGAAADFNHDGKLDLVLVSYPNGYYFGTNNQHPALLFFAGNGDGTFAAPITSALGTSATFEPGQFFFQSPVATDVDGDGYPDIVLNSAYGYTQNNLNGATLSISVFGNRTNGTFGVASQGTRLPDATAAVGTYPATSQDLKLLTGIFFGRTVPDFAVPALGTSPGIYLVPNASSPGVFALGTPSLTAYPGLQNVATGTFTGSGFTDLLISNGTVLTALINNGANSFGGLGTSPVVFSGLTLATSNTLFATADANGDGYSDIYTATTSSTGLALAVNLVSGSATATSQPFSLPIGTTETAANWPGNINYLGSSASGLQTIVPTPSSVTLTSSLNPSPLGTPVTFNALVASLAPANQVPSGSVTFLDGSTPIGTGTLDSYGNANITTGPLTAGTHAIQATYTGDALFAASNATVFQQGVTAPGQLTANLLLNPGAELGLVSGAIPYWTPAGQGSPTLDTGTFDGGINPHTGTYDFVGFNGPSDSLSQTVSLVTQGITAAMLDTGLLRASLSFWEQGLNQGTPSDDASVTLTFLDANGATLSSVTTPEVDSHNNTWQNYTNTYPIPTGARSAAYTMNFIRHAGSDLDGFVDDNSLLILAASATAATPALTWTPPAAIPYGTPLSATQLNATALNAAGIAIPGVFTYTPAAGTVLPLGVNTLSVLFTPTDLTAYTTATATVPLTVLPAPVTATLTITSGTAPAVTAPQGTVITLTAAVLNGATPITSGQVKFCDAAAPTCTDIHLIGTAQITSTGTATLKFIPSIGTHTYKAAFLGTTTFTATSSASATLTITGQYVTATTLAQTGTAGNYTLTATTTGLASPSASPTGSVSFLDTTNANTVLATASLGSGTAGVSFATSSSATSGLGYLAVLVADLNGDGKPDLAVTNRTNNTVTTLLGNGDGTFTASSTSPTGNTPQNMASGDFNADGKIDLAIANVNDGTVTILLGNGDGSFTAPTSLTTTGQPVGVAVADFNGDGIADLAVTTQTNNTVNIFLGRGDGTFLASTVAPAIGNTAFVVVTGDFNNDGKPDLAVSNFADNTLTILLGNGDGSFTTAPTVVTGNSPLEITAGDFNGDGKLDLAVPNFNDNTVSILLGRGDGTFVPTSTIATGTSPYSVATGDFNGDGKLDLAVPNFRDNTVIVLLGRGDGTFTPNTTVAVGTSPSFIAIGDFNGDGDTDVAVANEGNGPAISLLQARLTQTATATATNISPIGTGTHQIVAAYPGSTLFAASTSAPVTLTAQPLATTITWTPTAPTIVYGTPLGSQQLNAVALSATGAPIAGTFTYTPAAGAILAAGTQTIRLAFTPTSAIYSPTTATQTITIAQATPSLVWPTPAPIAAGTALSATQLNATATGVTGAALPGVFTYTPAAGAVPTGTQTLSVTFTPTDAADYATASRTVQLQVVGLTLTSITPNNANLGDPARTITLTGTGFTSSVLAQVNGTRLATTFVNATTVTAIIPAANFATAGTLQITILNPTTSATSAALPLTVTAPAPAVTLTGPTTTAPGTQPALALTITNPYPIPLTATFTLSFASAVTPTVDDPSIQFANGGRTFAFTVPANSTTVPAIQLQAGTVAGTITIPLTLTAAGANVTPTTIQPLTIVVPGTVPAVSTATLTRAGTQLTVTIHGFSNTREVAQAAFHFIPATGAQIDTPDVTIPVTTTFAGWFSSTPSVQYGSSFTYTQIFTVSDTTASIGSVQVTLTNAVGVSTVYTAQ